MIYFIQDESNQAIKIGFTASDKADGRLSALQTGNSSRLVLLKVIPGGLWEERLLHERFAPLRLAGEWFRPGPELLIYIIQAEGLDARLARALDWFRRLTHSDYFEVCGAEAQEMAENAQCEKIDPAVYDYTYAVLKLGYKLTTSGPAGNRSEWWVARSLDPYSDDPPPAASSDDEEVEE